MIQYWNQILFRHASKKKKVMEFKLIVLTVLEKHVNEFDEEHTKVDIRLYLHNALAYSKLN